MEASSQTKERVGQDRGLVLGVWLWAYGPPILDSNLTSRFCPMNTGTCFYSKPPNPSGPLFAWAPLYLGWLKEGGFTLELFGKSWLQNSR